MNCFLRLKYFLSTQEICGKVKTVHIRWPSFTIRLSTASYKMKLSLMLWSVFYTRLPNPISNSFQSLWENFNKMRQKIICLWLFLMFVLNVMSSTSTIRQTLNGPVEGVVQKSVLGQLFYGFLGIPFAEPPITGIDPYTGKRVDRRFKVWFDIKLIWSWPRINDFRPHTDNQTFIP